uniref:Ig-like domain-containing protein n=1 Tax=Plectus sambesii TaxID=2011161 RepID=A0A914VU36_9BILA
MMMSTNASGSSQKLVKMVTWRAILFVGLCWLLIMDRSSEACAPTFPGEDITEEDITESPVPISPVPTCLVGTTPLGSFSPTPGSTVVEGATVTLTCDASAQLDGTVATATCSAGVLSPTSLCVPTCLVGTTPYGSFSPAPGSTVLEGDTVTLTCDASAYLDGAVVTATCSSGVLSSTSLCLPCPDTTWIYDSTTDRCFKAFAATPVPGMCSKDVPCAGLAALYGAPSALAYTLNFQALV